MKRFSILAQQNPPGDPENSFNPPPTKRGELAGALYWPSGEGVYIVETDPGFVKIGYSKNVKKRLTTLQIPFGKEIRLLMVVDGDRALEKEFHQKFDRFRVRPEVFLLEADLLKWVNTLRKRCGIGAYSVDADMVVGARCVAGTCCLVSRRQVCKRCDRVRARRGDWERLYAEMPELRIDGGE
jgi:hypothetical protein